MTGKRITAGTAKLKGGTSQLYTTVLESSTLAELKNLAYWDRRKIKDIFAIAIETYITKWKKDPQNKAHLQDGEIKSIP